MITFLIVSLSYLLDYHIVGEVFLIVLSTIILVFNILMIFLLNYLNKENYKKLSLEDKVRLSSLKIKPKHQIFVLLISLVAFLFIPYVATFYLLTTILTMFLVNKIKYRMAELLNEEETETS